MASQDQHLVRWNLLAGVGLTSLCVLTLQISLTRLFSVALWHHFAFMVVSIAFLGFAASGTFLMMVPGIKKLPLAVTLSHLSFGFSVATLAAYWTSNLIPFDPARIMWDRHQWAYLLAYYAVLAVPFFFAGLILALVYTRKAATVNKLYAFDLAGAGAGCVAALFLYATFGETGTVLVVCLLSVLASLAFHATGWKANILRGLWLLTLSLLIFFSPGFLAINISPYKAMSVALRYPGARVLKTDHDLSARVDVIESGAVRFSPGLSLEFNGRLPEQLGLCLDAGYLSAVTRLTGKPGELDFTEHLPAALPYAISEPEDVLIMEPLGGLDILVARHHGAKRITTSHSYPIALRVMRGALSEFSGRLYDDGVLAIEEDGRSFLLRSMKRFDVIQLPLTDSVGAASSGLYGLSEQYTLTVEAFQAYINALTTGGFVAATKYLLPPPRHELRIVALADAALRNMGVKAPGRHLAAIRSWGTFTLLVKKSPFEAGEIERIKAFCRKRRFDVVTYPGMQRSEANQYNRFPGPLYHDMIQRILHQDRYNEFYASYLFDVQPVTDDRPFFYNNFRMDKAFELYRAVGNKWQLFLEGGYLVHLILCQAVLITLILVAFPFTKRKTVASSWFLSYFGLIGMAFMLTEICLIQRFILFLARPAHAFSVVLFSVLVASSFGSYCSRKVIVQNKNGAVAVKKLFGRVPLLIVTPFMILAYAFSLDRLLMLTMASPLWVRYALSFFVILPLGFVMGVFFPAGVRVLGQFTDDAIPWAWAVNASVSVVASVLAVVLALSWGFTAVLCVAAVAYGLALMILPLMGRGRVG